MKHKKYIHLFQDSNGKVEKLIIFKECLKYISFHLVIDENINFFIIKILKNMKMKKAT